MTESDQNFKIMLAHELIFAWQDATHPEALASLERVMCNIGMEKTEDAWELILMNGGRLHVGYLKKPNWTVIDCFKL